MPLPHVGVTSRFISPSLPLLIKSIHDIVYLTKPTWPSRLPVESEKQAQIPVESFLWLRPIALKTGNRIFAWLDDPFRISWKPDPFPMFSKRKAESRIVGSCVRSTIPLAFRSEKPSERALSRMQVPFAKPKPKASRPNCLLMWGSFLSLVHLVLSTRRNNSIREEIGQLSPLRYHTYLSREFLLLF